VSAVEVVGLTKEFTRRKGRSRTRVKALDAVSLTLARGECVAILGQNGSGKSTLVRALSTLLIYESGTARVFGHDVAHEERAVRRLVNRVSVEASFFKRLSAFENLSYAARFYGLGRSQTKTAIPEILASVGFPAERSRAPMEDLSRGMQQKVALARALLTAPTLLLLDEPTTGLDPRSKRDVQEFISEIRRTHDTTTLLCTHDMAEAETLADRVGILHRGRLLALEDPAALRRRYAAATLEDAFFAATGRAIEDEVDDDDEEAA
jgi:ABC-2 type transport system ATP-binding protein